MTLLGDIRARALASLIPPQRLRLSDWIEANIKLPEGASALPGAVRLCGPVVRSHLPGTMARWSTPMH
jgi:hypothetical protein